jgi:aminobenzoyl-glutamate transport protein
VKGRNGAGGAGKRSFVDSFLGFVERAGNALPHPATLFLGFALAVVALSAIAVFFDWSATHPGTGAAIEPRSLATKEGVRFIVERLVENFTSFAPLGAVLVAMLGIGVAEASGLIAAAMRLLVSLAPPKLLTPAVVLAGVLSNTASDLGYVLLVPLSAAAFKAAGRHPLLGLAASFAGVSGGFSANLLLGTIDPLVAGITQEAARLVDPEAHVNPACNYYFMAASTFLATGLGWFVTERIVAPRLGAYVVDPESADATATDAPRGEPTAAEKRGLLFALIGILATTGVILIGVVPFDGALRGEGGDLFKSPLLRGVVSFIFLYGVVSGVAYGIGARTTRNDADVIKGMSKAMGTLGGYLVLVFFAAQFVAYFNWTQLGLLFGVKGAEALKASGIGGAPLLFALIVLSAAFNMLMGSASAKWAVLAPVFVPMFMLLGYDPAEIQCAYRIGDSCTNIISPMMSFYALIIAYVQRYDSKAGLGSLTALMLPYAVVFFFGWSAFFLGWRALGIPFGPS